MSKNNKVSALLLTTALLIFAGCAGQTEDGTQLADDPYAGLPVAVSTAPGGGALLSLDDDDEYLTSAGTAQVIADPLEPWNRFWFSFNDGLIDYVLRPAHAGYRAITPEFFRQGVSNFFHNLKFPVRFINCLLQGKGMEAGVELSSFIFNTTMGLGGLFDLASGHEKVVETHDEDGGQTFGVWGVGEGFYIVWPVFGPSNVRDTLGMGLDYLLNPTNYLLDSWEAKLALSITGAFNNIDKTITAYDSLKGISIEPYTAIRDGYTQLRRAQIAK